MFKLRQSADLTKTYIITSSNMEMIQVKVNTLSPTASVQEMTNNKTCPVSLKDLNVGQFNGNLWFACSDVLPVTK